MIFSIERDFSQEYKDKVSSEGLVGEVVKEIYTKDNDPSAVCYRSILVSDINNGKIISVVGEMAVELNRIYEFHGTVSRHVDYGDQLSCSFYNEIYPTDQKGVIDFLSNCLNHKVARSKLKRVYQKLGSDCLIQLSKDPDILGQFGFISKKHIKKLKYKFELKKYKKQFGNGLKKLEKVIKKRNFKVSDKQINEAWRFFINKLMVKPSEVVSKFKEDPYILWREDIFDFKTINIFAYIFLKMQIANKIRFREGVRFILERAKNNECHTYLPFSNSNKVIYRKFKKEVMFNQEGNLSWSNFIEILKDVMKNNHTFIYEDKKLYLSYMYRYEKDLADHLVSIVNDQDLKNVNHINDLDSEIIKVEKNFRASRKRFHSFSEGQKKAIKRALTDNVSVIFGLPGSGKTSVIEAISIIYLKYFPQSKIRQCALAGIAAKRIEEITNITGSCTIHKMLGGSPGGEFDFNSSNPLPEHGLVFLDEASMCDVEIMYRLVSSLGGNYKLIILGDYHQLPSIGAGEVLLDIINSDVIPSVELTDNFRQMQGSKIHDLADYTVNNQYSEIDRLLRKSNINRNLNIKNFIESQDNLLYVPVKNDNQSYKSVVKIIKKLVSLGVSADDIHSIVPMRKNFINRRNGRVPVKTCTWNLNPLIRDIINSREGRKGRALKIDDRILAEKNDYDLEVLNGEQGKIIRVDDDSVYTALMDNGEMIDFKESDVKFIKGVSSKFKNFIPDDRTFNLAYSLTVHKAQGCEFPIVIVAVSEKHPSGLLMRELLYTAVTRAVDKLILVAESNSFKRALRRERKSRYTDLENKLIRRNEIEKD